jgi:hypothetical protein
VSRCSVFGHRFRFTPDGATMRWACARGCGAGGEKTYDTPEEAARYAAAFDRTDSSRVSEHPTLSTLPLWIARRLRRRVP